MITKADFKDIKWVLSEHGEFPSFYSDTSCRMISSKYFAKDEQSMIQLVARVADTIANAGWNGGYFNDKGEMEVFARAVAGGMLRQEFMFNSPVLFNVGVEEEPQCSACFIQGVSDNMGSILDLAKKEGMLFKYGSGTGTNFSQLRGRNAPLSSGGSASGVIEFMKMFDAGAGVIKSGGKTRRAAKMVILNQDHADIDEFIRCKADEEKLVKEGLPLERAYFQNGNNTVRVSGPFMQAASDPDGPEDQVAWQRLHDMAQAAWECGDPGIQFHDTINKAMPKGLECNASNPCGEFLFIDDSACNLASINLVKCDPTDARKFMDTVTLLITAMDIIVDMASYPSTAIEENSLAYRPLGLGYTNLGTYLMNKGIAYGSPDAVRWTETITERMHMYAVATSKNLGSDMGCYPDGNMRNAQVTLLAPTGTISFAMGCESTGIEPVFSEEIHKELEGGGTIVSVPQCIRDAEERRDYSAITVALSTTSDRNVPPLAHLQMMAAAQKHLSGAISKTVNMPEDCTVQDIFDVYVTAWKLGLKGVAVFRNGSKSFQPMTTKAQVDPDHEELNAIFDKAIEKKFARAKLPSSRRSETHKVSIAGMSTYITLGYYPDGTPGEVFISMSKVGSSVRSWADSWATLLSIALQSGVPLDKLIAKFRGTKFEPSGFTGREDIKYVDSVVDCVMQLLERVPVGGDLPAPELDHQVATQERKAANVGTLCVECGTVMHQTGTCYTCPSCGNNLGGCS